MVSEWVELKPSESWINATKARAFDGNILVRNWEGKVQKIFTYENGTLLPVNSKRSANLGSRSTARTSDDDEDPGDGGDTPGDDNEPCFVTQTITVVRTPKRCPCMEHTYEQYDVCNCSTKPEPGYNTTYTVTYEIDCSEPPEDPPIGGGGGGGGGGSPDPGSGGGGSGDDYPPISCNPDPDYEVPTTPPPPGTEYAVPCDQLDLPVDELPNNWGTEYLSPVERLIAYYNASADPAMHIGTEEQDWMHAHPNEIGEILQYMNAETNNANAFGRWAILYLTQNENLDFAIFRKWFLSQVPEGMDGIMDESQVGYWDDPNLVVQQQTLPSDAAFDAAFPKYASILPMPASEVYQLVGGPIYALHLADPINYGNACALRVSRGLNYSGITIPNIPGQTYKGGDNKYYFLSAVYLLGWMKKTFTNFVQYTGAQGGTNGSNFPTLLDGKKGIYIIIPNYSGRFGASGHADYWQNWFCNGDCYFNMDDMGGVNAVYFWQLN